MSVSTRFTEEELTAIRDAAAAAETETAGEIVVVIVDRCDAYNDALWKAAAIGGLGGALVAATWHAAAGLWGGWPVLWMAGPALAGAAILASMAALLPVLRRALVGRETIARRVHRRAAVALLDEGVTRTRDRTGVLLLVALFEHRVEIIGDDGLRDRVAPEAWDDIARDLAAALHERRRPGPAVAEAIAACGRVLADAGVAPRHDDLNHDDPNHDDPNELPDDARLRDV